MSPIFRGVKRWWMLRRMKIEELFPAGRILEERLGREPFEALPREPGIYRFYDERGALLYVGKAINLRRRLFTYRRALPGQVSRKVDRKSTRLNSSHVA